MNTAERIYAEVKHIPEDLADRVLDYVLFLKQRHALGRAVQDTQPDREDLPVLDTRGWHFDREEANAR